MSLMKRTAEGNVYILNDSDYKDAMCYQESEENLWRGLYSMIKQMAELGGERTAGILTDLKNCVHNFPKENNPLSTYNVLQRHSIEPATSFNINDIERVQDDLAKQLRREVSGNGYWKWLTCWTEIKNRLDSISWQENKGI